MRLIAPLLLLLLLMFSGAASATITGDSPNAAGITTIDEDTTWDGEVDVYCGGNVTIGNATTIIDVTFKNCNNITIADDILIGDGSDYPINFTIYNSTINWGSNESELILEQVLSGNGVIGTILNISVSTIQRDPNAISYLETHPTNRALGLYLKSAPRPPYFPGVYHLNTVKIYNTTLADMGRYWGRHPSTTRWLSGNYGTISPTMLQTGAGLGYNYTTDSILENLTFWNCEQAYLGCYNPASTAEPFSTYKNFNLSCSPDVPMSQGCYNTTTGEVGYIMGLQYIGGPNAVVENLYSNGVARVTDNPQAGTVFINAELHECPESWKTMGMFLGYITWRDSEFWYIIGDTGYTLNTGHNITYENCSFHRSGYGGSSYNFTVRNCTHDITGATGAPRYFSVCAENSLITECTFENISKTAVIGDITNLHGSHTKDITLTDTTFYNLTGVGTDADFPSPKYESVYFVNTDNLLVRNVSFTTVRSSIHVKNIINSVFDNITGDDFYEFADEYGALIIKNCTDNVWRDIDINGTLVFWDSFGNTTNNKFINANFSGITYGHSLYLPYYYLDVKVEDSAGNPIEGATVTIVNNVDSNYPSVNVDGENKTSFTTGIDGHIPKPSDAENSAAVADYHKNNASQTSMNFTITASKAGHGNDTAIVNVTSAWYRSVSDTYQNTTLITLSSWTYSNTTAYFNNTAGHMIEITTKTDGTNIFNRTPTEEDNTVASGTLKVTT